MHRTIKEAKKTSRPGMSLGKVSGIALLAACMGLAQVTHASETERLMEILVEKGILSAAEADAIRAEARAEPAGEKVELIGAEMGYEPTQPVKDSRPNISAFPFGVQSADGKDIFRIRGRVQMDAAWQDFGDDIQNVARQGHSFPNYGVILRRVRLGALGVFQENWEWQLEVDFAENEVDLANAYLAYLTPHGRLAAGYFKEPFTMEYATSSRYITFMERSTAVDAYKTNREPGLMFETIKPNWYGAIGIFGGGIEYDREVQEGWAIGGRLSVAPYLDGTDFVHLGGSFNYRSNAKNRDTGQLNEVRLRTREGTRAIDARLIGRDDLVAIDNYTRSGLELAAGRGPWWMQTEYVRVDLDIDRDALADALSASNRTDRSSLTQDGWYFQTGYFLTGESKPYRAFSGDFGRLRPNQNFSLQNGGRGALELAFRYSVADSLEHTRVGRGQKLETWTGGLNWYLNPETLIRANVIYLEGERDVFKDDGWVYGLRMQYLF